MSPTSDRYTTDFQIGTYKARAMAALEEYQEGMAIIFRKAYERFPKYATGGIPFDLLSCKEIMLIEQVNETCEKKFKRLKDEIEARYGFEIQIDNVDEFNDDFSMVQQLPDGTSLWYYGGGMGGFDIDYSWVKA